jgi:serine/threonine-protein kinase
VVADREHVKLLDFGIGRVIADPSMTSAGRIVGTPQYMSPEQAMGSPVDSQSDVYSLGVVAYECICGERPFVAESIVALMTKHVIEPPQPPSSRSPTTHLSPEFEALILEMLAKRPEDRPAHGGVLRTRIEAIQKSLNASGDATPTLIDTELREWASRPRTRTIPPATDCQDSSTPPAGEPTHSSSGRAASGRSQPASPGPASQHVRLDITVPLVQGPNSSNLHRANRRGRVPTAWFGWLALLVVVGSMGASMWAMRPAEPSSPAADGEQRVTQMKSAPERAATTTTPPIGTSTTPPIATSRPATPKRRRSPSPSATLDPIFDDKGY